MCVKTGEDGQRISIGDVGVVVAPCQDYSLSDSHNRLVCTFPNFQRACVRLDWICAETHELAGGFRIGEAVVSNFSQGRAGRLRKVRRGDVGKVIGPGIYKDEGSPEAWLLCQFPNYRRIHVLSDLVYRPGVELPGGFFVGDSVISTFACVGKRSANVKLLAEGVVLGPCDNSAAPTPEQRILCKFPNFAQINVRVNLVYKIEEGRRFRRLPSGFHVRDWVRSNFAEANETGQKIEVGEAGIVIGPCNSTEVTAPEQAVLCAFTNWFPINVNVHQITKLPGKPYQKDIQEAHQAEAQARIADGSAAGGAGGVLKPGDDVDATTEETKFLES